MPWKLNLPVKFYAVEKPFLIETPQERNLSCKLNTNEEPF
jgi:hypothetical protein